MLCAKLWLYSYMQCTAEFDEKCGLIEVLLFNFTLYTGWNWTKIYTSPIGGVLMWSLLVIGYCIHMQNNSSIMLIDQHVHVKLPVKLVITSLHHKQKTCYSLFSMYRINLSICPCNWQLSLGHFECTHSCTV